MESNQLISFIFNGYFDRLLEIVDNDEEEGSRKKAAELYLTMVRKTKRTNSSISDYMLYKIKTQLERIGIL